MLLTKPLTTLLSTSLAPPLTTVLLLTPSGHILSSASPLPSSLLRARATLALQIWDLYAPHPSTIAAALPPSSSTTTSTSTASSADSSADHSDLASIAVQLSAGILVIRALRCGLLVCGLSSSPPATTTQHADARPVSPHAHRHMHHFLTPGSPPPDGALASSAASDAGSVATVAGRPGGRDVAVLRRRVEEVGKWLDGELGGFAISDGV